MLSDSGKLSLLYFCSEMHRFVLFASLFMPSFSVCWLLNFAFFLWECSVTAACYASSGTLQTIILYSASQIILCKYIQETLVRIKKIKCSKLGTKTGTLLSLSNPTVYSFVFLLYQTYEVPSHLYHVCDI